MVVHLSDEVYEIVRNQYGYYIPAIHIIEANDKDILNYYNGKKEFKYSDFYNKRVTIHSNTPWYNDTDENTILIKTSNECSHNIEVTSKFETVYTDVGLSLIHI